MDDLLGLAMLLQVEPPERTDWQRWQRALAKQARKRMHFYRSLSPVQGKELALAMRSLIERGENTDYLAEVIFTNLVNVVPGSLDGLHHMFLEWDIFWGCQGIYREADAAIRDHLITLLEADDIAEHHPSRCSPIEVRKNLLAALAWIGDERVQEHFLKWKKTPPSWNTSRKVSRFFRQPLDSYTHYAGWELADGGQKRMLYFPQCYELLPLEEVSGEDVPGPISVIGLHSEQCMWCGRQLLTLFDFNLRDSHFAFLHLKGDRLRIPLCASCSIFEAEPPFFDVDIYGASHWSPLNEIHDAFEAHESLSFVPGQLVLGARRYTPFETNDLYFEPGLSQIGGHPGWIYEPDYPLCPGCQQTMMFVGQFVPMDTLADSEGIIYAFLCIDCAKTTTRYQCT